MEAAALLLVFMLLLALLVQPVCIAYTQAVMHHAAAEALRVAATTKDDGVVRSFALRRLEAVPQASVFHTGGNRDWVIELTRAPNEKAATMRISGHLRPLPFVGALSTIACERDGEGVLLTESVTRRMRPMWLEGEYENWMSSW